ncbi:MAG: tRNA glutamyl-Q(34) synthetase GluQRS [Pseudomonadales bacterium]
MGGSYEVAAAGRFAPSPTGPLHLGSLLAATASYLDARAHGLNWQVRLDDLDQPRNQPGAEQAILLALERHGLLWDGPVSRQSENGAHYAAALSSLAEQGLLFYCRCSRKQLAAHAVYPGTCRAHRQARSDAAIRVRVDEEVIEFDDLVLGPQREALDRSGGDFVVRRRDGIVAYQLATAVDDGNPGITRVIRGRDLLENTPRQIYLMRRLGLAVPVYGHIPLLVNTAGQKLSKQTGARPLDLDRPEENLTQILRALGIAPKQGNAGFRGCAALLSEALAAWSLEGIPRNDTVANRE